MEPFYVQDGFGGHWVYPDRIEPADPVLYRQRIRRSAQWHLEENMWHDVHVLGIEDPEILQREAYYRENTLRLVHQEAAEITHDSYTLRVMTFQVKLTPPPGPAGPSLATPPPVPEESIADTPLTVGSVMRTDKEENDDGEVLAKETISVEDADSAVNVDPTKNVGKKPPKKDIAEKGKSKVEDLDD